MTARLRHYRDRDHTGTENASQVALSSAIGRYPAGTDVQAMLIDLEARIRAAFAVRSTFTADAVIV